ncbi:MAG: SET domain-containing protein-lysine N-methyltransferase [Myxococcaceae bacterium]|nr:SET domain-containing protein-lysine N-methyltransferase [Myxococcaceae bacterium]
MTDSTSKKRTSSSPSSTPASLSFELRRSPIQGLGAFATRRIRKGTRIIEYTGERISQDEADTRYNDEAMSRHHTFLFTLDEKTVLDAAVGGNEARFINHSCDPNCQALIEDDRIFIYALKNIEPGTELVYDYAYERAEGMDEESEELYVCRCGAKSCRGTILAPPAPPKRARKKKAKPAKRSKRS